MSEGKDRTAGSNPDVDTPSRVLGDVPISALAPALAPASLSLEEREEYEVGYCRPPKDHRFREGRSGNPRGRPRKRPRMDVPIEFAWDILDVAKQKVVVNRNGKRKIISINESVLLSIATKAATGDSKAQNNYTKLLVSALKCNDEFSPDLKLAHMIDIEMIEKNPELKRIWMNTFGKHARKVFK